MRNKMLGSAVLAIAMLAGSVSCSKEIDNGLDSRNGNQALQFSIKNGKGALVTYAIAEGDQWTINTIDVYAFSGGSLVGAGKMTEGTDYTIQTTGGTSTITATPVWLSSVTGQTVSFYFVANDATSTSGAHITGTIPMSETDFKELLTNKLAGPDGEGKYGLITPVLLFSDVVADVPLTGKVQKDVELIRRDARFDIYNNMSSSIEVNKIYVSNANIQGHIFGTATGTNTPATGSHEAITGPVAADYDATTFLATSVFHLYPTTLGKAADGKTEIVIEATVGGVAQNFTLKGEMDVVANHRYILKLDPVSLTFTVTVADYEEGNGGNPIETELGGDATIDPLSNFGGTGFGNYDNGVYVFNNEPNTLTFDAVSTYGTQARAIHIVGDTEANGYTDLIVNKTSTITYSGISVKDSYTVNVPTAIGGSYKINLEIYSPGGEGKQVITFVMGAVDITKRDPKVTDPAFAKWIAENIGNGSTYLTQEEMDAVTTINIEGITEIESVNGIENFQFLNDLNTNGSGVTGSLNLSNNSNITTINLSNTSLANIDLSGNPNLKYADIRWTEVSFVDITGNQSLDTLMIGACLQLTHIELNNPNLKVLDMYGCSNYEENLDLTKVTGLLKLNISKTKISSIDLSPLASLKALAAIDCVLTVVDLTHNANIESIQVQTSTTIETIIIGSVKEFLIYITANSCPNFTSFDDLAYAPNLTNLRCNICPSMSTIDITNNPFLRELLIGGTGITELDMSNCKNLKRLGVQNIIGGSITIYAWDEGTEWRKAQFDWFDYSGTATSIKKKVM